MTNEKVIQDLRKISSMYGHQWIKDACDMAISELDKQMPTVEAEPRHGRWIKQTFQSIIGTDVNTIKTYVGIVCSECGKAGVTINPSTGETAYKYCPYCGAKMDGKENG